MKKFHAVREIYTPFFSNKADEILRSMLGQLSDGLWENSRRYEKYWLNFDVKRNASGQVYFAVSNDYYKVLGKDCYTNPFIELTDAEFLDWIAVKLKTVIKTEIKDNPNNFTGGGWKRNNTSFESRYLSYDETITVADIYVIYDWLKGRKIDMHSPIVKAVFGETRSEDQIKKIKDKQSEIELIQANRDRLIATVKEQYTTQIANLKKQLVELKKKMEDDVSDVMNDCYVKIKAIREEIEKISA